jgi:hypothetical protein
VQALRTLASVVAGIVVAAAAGYALDGRTGVVIGAAAAVCLYAVSHSATRRRRRDRDRAPGD